MEKRCLNCKKPFKATRITKKFCSNACKVDHARKKPTVVDEIRIEMAAKFGPNAPEAPPNWPIDSATGVMAQSENWQEVPQAAYDNSNLPIDNDELKWPSESKTNPDRMLVFPAPAWVKSIRDYCEQQGLIPEDLIESHRNLKKPKKRQESKEMGLLSDYQTSLFRNQLRKQKCGILPPEGEAQK